MRDISNTAPASAPMVHENIGRVNADDDDDGGLYLILLCIFCAILSAL